MSLTRIFVSSKLQSKQKIVLDESPSRHLLQVLRLKIDSPLMIFNNSGGEFLAKITGINKRRAEVTLGDFVLCDRESPLSIHLVQGISRGERMDFVVQKAVELGIKKITPLFTEYCNVKLKDARLEKKISHWQKVAISAAEQSGRCYVPEVLPAKSFADWIKEKRSELCLVFEPGAKERISDIKPSLQDVTILIGPEGGLSEEEVKLAKDNNFLSKTLGPRILRTETAALAVISILQAAWGDV